jgi:hypothetical protein
MKPKKGHKLWEGTASVHFAGEFPEEWSEEQIKDVVSEFLSNKDTATTGTFGCPDTVTTRGCIVGSSCDIDSVEYLGEMD